jgi:CBS domain-containing protein
VTSMSKRPTARNVMTSPIETIEETATVEKAAAKMLSKRVSSLVVSPASPDEPFGIVTTSDIARALGRCIPPRDAQVGDIMSSPLLLVTPHVPAVYVARMMDRASVRHVAVFNGRNILGIVSSRDLLKAMMPDNAGTSGRRRSAAGRVRPAQ